MVQFIIIATQPPKLSSNQISLFFFFNLIYFLFVYFNVFIVISHF